MLFFIIISCLGVPLVAAVFVRLFLFRRFSIATQRSKAMESARQSGRPRALLVSSVHSVALALCLWAIAYWGVRRYFMTLHSEGARSEVLLWTFNVLFVLVGIQLLLAFAEREYFNYGWVNPKVAVLVPVYNEDPQTLETTLRALLDQSQVPQEIHVVDDGSCNPEQYDALKKQFLVDAVQYGVRATWERTPNQGKRHAQAAAFRKITAADVFVTVDSDSILDRQAVEKLCRPFCDQQIQSVAGIILAWNNRCTLLARVTDMLFVTQQLTDRSSMSRLQSVLVNSGGIAAYRVSVLSENIETYLREEYLGRPVSFSDDSMLTLFALRMGKTVQQPSAIAFAMMPTNFSHHYRQQIRWFRGSFIRGLWRVKFLPVASWGFARQLIGWVQLLVASVLAGYIFVWMPITTRQPPPIEAVLVPAAISYAQGLRFMTVWRSDRSRASQWLTFLFAPLMAVWQNCFLRPLRIWGIVSSRKMDWNTRQVVEVTMKKTT